MNTTPGQNSRLITPDWPAPPSVRALCSTRLGGASTNSEKGQYASFNLGDHVGDAPAAVTANRQTLAAAMQARPVFLQQVHGTQALTIDAHTPDGSMADACSTQAHGVACTIMVADCLPVLFCNATGTQVAAAHAGWRGLAGGVLEQTLEAFLGKNAEKPAQAAIKNEVHQHDHILAWLGPCIGPSTFEVGTEVREAFLAAYPWCGDCFLPHPASAGKSFCDLAAIARGVLQRSGVAVYGNDGRSEWCTYTHAEQWFSHRRESQQGRQAGRMAACIWLQAPALPSQT